MNAAGHVHVEESTNFLKAAICLYNILYTESGALVRLFSSPSLYWMKTVIELFSTDFRRVSSRGFRDQGPVVRRRISANTGLNFNLDFFTPLFESLFGVIPLFYDEYPIIKFLSKRKEWGGEEQLTKSGTWGRSMLSQLARRSTRMLVSGIFKQPGILDRECFLLQMKCMMSGSFTIIFYWTWLIIAVWKIEP